VAYVLLFALFYHQIRNNLWEKIISYIFWLYFGLNFLSILVCKKHYLFDAISGALLALSIYFWVRKKVTKNIFDFLFLKPSLMKK
jgi:membrane-associated phospholipid phosphatase